MAARGTYLCRQLDRSVAIGMVRPTRASEDANLSSSVAAYRKINGKPAGRDTTSTMCIGADVPTAAIENVSEVQR